VVTAAPLAAGRAALAAGLALLEFPPQALTNSNAVTMSEPTPVRRRMLAEVDLGDTMLSS
jgi:hypothetical protein